MRASGVIAAPSLPPKWIFRTLGSGAKCTELDRGMANWFGVLRRASLRLVNETNDVAETLLRWQIVKSHRLSCSECKRTDRCHVYATIAELVARQIANLSR